MDSFEFNKIIGAVLATGLCLVALNITAEAVFAPHHPAKPGFEIDIKPQAPAAGPAAPPAAGPPPPAPPRQPPRKSRSKSSLPAPRSTGVRWSPSNARPVITFKKAG